MEKLQERKEEKKKMKNYEIKKNAAYDSYEIYFDGIPSNEIRAALKALRFRWHATKKCWYGYSSAEELENILNGAEHPKAEQPKAEKKRSYKVNADDKKLIRKNYDAIWSDEHMAEWATNQVQYIIREDEKIILLDKIRLETSFCYGYGFCGRYSDEEEERAHDKARAMDENRDNVFTKENTRGLDEQINALKEILEDRQYTRESDKIRQSTSIEEWRKWLVDNEPKRRASRYYNCELIIEPVRYSGEQPHNIYRYNYMTPYEIENTGATLATDEQIKKYKEALEEQRENLIKRCETYLKKYGTSKLNVWTYISD